MSFYSIIFSLCCSRSWTSLVAQTIKNPLAIKDTQVWSLGQEDPLEKKMATHSNILAKRIQRTEGVTNCWTRMGNIVDHSIGCKNSFPLPYRKNYTLQSITMWLKVSSCKWGTLSCTTDIKVGHVTCSGQQHEQCSWVTILSRSFIRHDIFLPALSLPLSWRYVPHRSKLF